MHLTRKSDKVNLPNLEDVVVLEQIVQDKSARKQEHSD